MIINDEYIQNYINNYYATHNKLYIKCLDKDVINYINLRYDDSDNFKESVYRILHNIENRPICRCGNRLKFKSLSTGYYQHCCNSCAQSDPNVYVHAVELKRKTYGSANNYNKIKQTNKIKYGVEYSFHRKEVMDKKRNTMIERYGDPNYRSLEKYKETCIKKYGTEYYLNSEDCKLKTIAKFGVDNYRKSIECKNKISEYHKTHKDELNEKRKQTSLLKYGVDNVAKVKEFMQSIDWSKIIQHQIETKRKNHTFNTSKLEDKSYLLLLNKFSDVITQYKSDKYPFLCDFYIPSLDLYIECNYHWTHGGKPFENTENDNIIIQQWKAKNTKYYINAINCWTIRDVNKRTIAKQNNLNYKEFFSILELNEWLNNYEI